MGTEPIPPTDIDQAGCPFLGTATATGEHVCLSRSDDVIDIGSSYARTYCLTAHHVACGLFLRAQGSKFSRLVPDRSLTQEGRKTPTLPTRALAEKQETASAAPAHTLRQEQETALTSRDHVPPQHETWTLTPPAGLPGHVSAQSDAGLDEPRVIQPFADKVGNALVLVGCAFMVAAVAVVALQYHRTPHPSAPSGTGLYPSQRPPAARANPLTIAPSATPHPSAAPTPARATPHVVQANPAATGAPATSLESWNFPALPHVSGTILLALYNPGAVPVLTDVRIRDSTGTRSRRVVVPPESTIKLDLPAQRGVPTLTVQVAPPIVPARLVVG